MFISSITCPRIPLFVNVIFGEEVLGVPIIPEGTTQNSKFSRSAFPLHQKLHAHLDKPPLKERSLLAQGRSICRMSLLSHLHPCKFQPPNDQASDINSCVQSNPTLGFTLILQLTGVHGSKQFDSLTKTKTVENIITSMSPDDTADYVNYLLEQVNDEPA